jgi:hypothetical protein
VSEPPPIAVALPGGTVVGTSRPALSDAAILNAAAEPTPEPKPPAAAAPIAPTPPTLVESPGVPPPVPAAPLVGPPPVLTNDCCGPIGGHGPIGQEIYMRLGQSFPLGNTVLARNVGSGFSGQIGVRAQFFEPAGDTAWAIDAHVVYTHNPADPQEIITLEDEPVSLRAIHRTGVGLGFGRDWFLNRPGFILDTWDTNFRLGWDLGGRWGSGHADFDTPFEQGGYRRRYDVYGQAFAGVMGTMEVPVGGWQFLVGGRIEYAYMFSDLLPRGANLQEVVGYFMFGVRY